ncbi:MAG TPA: glycosyltransferase N-terminal domain-containing protein [Bacteroidales bacterium]|nr:glycosyltransferase N-terminal domain-containing protein [Bacteroidales bacterium]HQI71138.1 glycosyltransferase N-terminal domain-containing protein [Bacteroidales bacterium]
MFFFYSLSVFFYTGLIKIASLFNRKARQWTQGRKQWHGSLKKAITKDNPWVWFHASSLGEFEQGRPVMEAFRQKYPQYKIVLTFFSPSGYEVRKNYDGADHVCYLPADTPGNVRKFIETVNPAMVFFIKYEFWFNYIRIINKKNIPLFFFSVKFRPGQHFFMWYGGWFRTMLKKINWIFVQDESSKKLLYHVGITNASVSGDTRFDRVLSVSMGKKPLPLIARFAEHTEVMIAGSTWPPDEDMMVDIINKFSGKLRFIIAPHEIHLERIRAFRQKLKVSSLNFSEANEQNITEARVLIIDSIGLLLHIYQYARFAYIGGGFGKNIHNILESATFGVPVIFGPNFHKFQEAIDLIKLGGAFPVNNYDEFETIVGKFIDDNCFRETCSKICKSFVVENAGATPMIMLKVAESIKD